MEHSERKRSSVGTLLLLAALDMLTASLVCAVVLFLVLVGSEADESSATPGADSFSAPSIIVLYFKGPAGPRLRTDAHGELEQTSHDDPLLGALLGMPPYSEQNYQTKGGVHQVVIEEATKNALLEIYPGNGEPVRLVLACSVRPDHPLTVSFGKETRIDSLCAAGGLNNDIIYPEGTQIRFKLSQSFPGALPEEWETQTSVPTSDEGRLVTLRAKKPASNKDLGVSARIAEILY